MTTNRTPKPEGPAQEPQSCLCVCPRCMPRDQERTSGGLHCGEGKCSRAPVPATPAPSQPAITNRFCTRCGKLNDGHQHEPPTRDRRDRPAFTGCCGTPTTGLSYVNPQHRADCPLRNAPSQPAARELDKYPIMDYLLARFAKDIVAAMERYARQQTAAKDAELADANQRVDFQRSQILDLDAAVERQTALKQAAERERDSLREANARLAADLDAALKAGKDGQK